MTVATWEAATAAQTIIVGASVVGILVVLAMLARAGSSYAALRRVVREAREHERERRTPPRGLWRFQCADVDVLTGAVHMPPTEFEGTERDARDFLQAMGGGILKATSADTERRILNYSIDWAAYREAVPSKWVAILMSTEKGGALEFPNCTRQEALDKIMGNGNHVIRKIDDRFGIVYYSENG